jgi:co-chaperonin GroES (HSP10)
MNAQVALARPTFDYASLEDAFPPIDPGLVPYGSRVLVQVRRAKTKTASGIIIAPEARGVEQDLTQIAKVIRLGPLAFKNRDRAETWPEGAWCKPGDFVRVPLHAREKWGVLIPNTSDEYAKFCVFDDLDLIGHVTCDPLSVVAYI